MTLTLNIIMGGALTGAAFNSARALGPMVAIGNFTNAWLYMIAPLVGAVMAALVHLGLTRRSRAADGRAGGRLSLHEALCYGYRSCFSVTFDKAIAQLEIAVREHSVALGDLVVRLRSRAISKEQFVAEIAPLHKAFERIVEELTREAKSSALAAMASLKAPESKARN
jgi:hypothetical protein